MGDTASLSAGGRPECQDQPLKTNSFREEWRKDWTGAKENVVFGVDGDCLNFRFEWQGVWVRMKQEG